MQMKERKWNDVREDVSDVDGDDVALFVRRSDAADEDVVGVVLDGRAVDRHRRQLDAGVPLRQHRRVDLDRVRLGTRWRARSAARRQRYSRTLYTQVGGVAQW